MSQRDPACAFVLNLVPNPFWEMKYEWNVETNILNHYISCTWVLIVKESKQSTTGYPWSKFNLGESCNLNREDGG